MFKFARLCPCHLSYTPYNDWLWTACQFLTGPASLQWAGWTSRNKRPCSWQDRKIRTHLLCATSDCVKFEEIVLASAITKMYSKNVTPENERKPSQLNSRGSRRDRNRARRRSSPLPQHPLSFHPAVPPSLDDDALMYIIHLQDNPGPGTPFKDEQIDASPIQWYFTER